MNYDGIIDYDQQIETLESLEIKAIQEMKKFLEDTLNSRTYREGDFFDKKYKEAQLHIINNYLTKKYTENI